MSTKPYGKEYADFAEKSFSWKAIEEPAISFLLGVIKNDQPDNDSPQILDLATGCGRLIPAFIETWPNANVTGVDISPTLLDIAAAKYPQATFIKRDVRSIKSLRVRPDIVMAHMIIHMLPLVEAELLFSRVCEKLPVGGHFLIGVPHAERLGKPSDLTTGFVEVATPWGATEACYPRQAEWYWAYLSQMGFEIELEYEPSVVESYVGHAEAANYNDTPSRLYILARKA